MPQSACHHFYVSPSTKSLYSRSFFNLILHYSIGEKKLFSLSRVSLTLHERPPKNESLHPPRVLEKLSRVQLFESDPIGHLVSLIVADDKDGDEIFFSIIDGDNDKDFYINPDQGKILKSLIKDF